LPCRREYELEDRRVQEGRSTIPEWLTMSEAVSLLDPPHRESPSLTDAARPACSLGLFLVLPAAFIVAATVFVLKFVLSAVVLPRW
jgi:hypothetical protein